MDATTSPAPSYTPGQRYSVAPASSSITERILLSLILIFASAIRLIYLNHPFQRDPEGCGSFYGLLARNYLRWPLLANRLVPIQSLGIGHGDPSYYPNHPGLLPMFIAIVFRLFGAGEWQTRLPTALFTIGCIVTVYVLLRSRAGVRAALLAAFFFAVSPMTLLFGGQPDVINSQLVFFILLTVAAYLRFHDRPNIPNLLLLTLAFLPAGLTDWPAFHLVIVLGLHFVCTRPLKSWPWIIAFGFLTIAIFMIPYGQGVMVKHDWRWMSKLVERRTMSNEADSTGSFTALDWFRNALFGFAYHRHNGPILPLLAVWIALAVSKWRKYPETLLIGLLLGWAFVHVIVGRQGVYVHEWWWWPLTPAAAMGAAVALDRLCPQNRPFSAALIGLACLFASWNTYQVNEEWLHPKQITTVTDPLNYSLAEIGEAIREAAPPNAEVLLGENDQSLSFWYYADRPLMQNVWYPGKFEEALASHQADLPFAGVEQQWTGPVSAYILPKAYANGKMQAMIDYMNAKYPRRETAKFLIWDLQAKAK